MEKKTSARALAFNALKRVFHDKGYSNLTLDHLLKEEADARERALASKLCYGVLERKLTLDPQILRYCRKRPDLETLIVLELGFYQLLYLSQIPPSAAVNESVNLMKQIGKKATSGFVNGVLRSFLRDECKIVLPKGKLASLEVETGMPQWILRMWERDYGFDTAKELAYASLGQPNVCLRVNTQKTSTDAVLQTLTAAGFEADKHPVLPDCIVLSRQGDVAALDGYRSGEFYLQDSASQLCAAALSMKEGERLFDLCAAPGGKSFTAALWMHDHGEVHSFDLHPQRVRLIESGAERLGLTSIRASVGDASIFDSARGTADAVLCDVPCSGLGVIRHKPEIRYKSEEELQDLPAIQQKILDTAAGYVRPGGRLVYSTCTLSKAENENNTALFLQNHPEFSPDPLPPLFDAVEGADGHRATLMPHKGNYDGFYIARFRREEK